LLNAVEAGTMDRPSTIVAMSSEPSCNEAMLKRGADLGIVKHRVVTLAFWP